MISKLLTMPSTRLGRSFQLASSTSRIILSNLQMVAYFSLLRTPYYEIPYKENSKDSTSQRLSCLTSYVQPVRSSMSLFPMHSIIDSLFDDFTKKETFPISLNLPTVLPAYIYGLTHSAFGLNGFFLVRASLWWAHSWTRTTKKPLSLYLHPQGNVAILSETELFRPFSDWASKHLSVLEASCFEFFLVRVLSTL